MQEEVNVEQNNQSNSNTPVAEYFAWAAKAEQVKQQAIKTLLEQQEAIAADLRRLGVIQDGIRNGSMTAMVREDFSQMKLADVARKLLAEYGALHGKTIENMAVAGGYKGSARSFQMYLPMALKRDGGFVNVGGNNWKLA